MYSNLEAEMKRQKITHSALAKRMGRSLTTISLKLNGKGNFTLPEAKLIKRILGNEFSLEYLFESDNNPSW